MRKCAKWAAEALVFAVIACSVGSGKPAAAQDDLAATLVERAQKEVARIQALVADGTLPKSRLEEAEAELADAQDQAILANTLYGRARIQDMTPAQADAMIAAAERRVERQKKIVEDRRTLLEAGILAQSEFTAFEDELESRERVLELARNRAKLLEDLRRMAESEQRFEQAAQDGAPAVNAAMIRYDGNGLFTLRDLAIISSEFEKQFHKSLPVSALGQTLVHQSMGLDHRNRVDVALNPDQPEGIWLRKLLERLHVPYLAFRSAVTGAATAAHIHIGPESTRLKLSS
jgi:hypothetical protein